MRIIIDVAADALVRGFKFFDRFGVAALAFRAAVCAAQGKFGAIVLKKRRFPVQGDTPSVCMTVCTLITIAAFVAVIFAMATDTIHADIAKLARVAVATATADTCRRCARAHPKSMPTRQWEFSQTMIKTRCRLPTAAVMAAFTVNAQASLMCIVNAVAGIAGFAGNLILARGLMAGAAFGVLVRTSEYKASFTVIEARALPISIKMAASAIAAHRTFMCIVFFVAADAAVFNANFCRTL